jgi:exopolysaccharide biosynthesis polyprenyl glycosylphosphotransferase
VQSQNTILSGDQLHDVSQQRNAAGRGVLHALIRKLGAPVMMQVAFDIVAVSLSFVLFYFVKLTSLQAHPLVPTAEFFFTVLVSNIVFWLTVYWLAGLYKNWYIRSPFDEAWTVVKASSTAGVAVLLGMSLDSGYVRVKFIPYVLLVIMAVVAFRLLARSVQRTLRIRRVITVPTLLVGSAEKITNLLRLVKNEPSWGYSVLGCIGDGNDDLRAHAEIDVPVLGSVEDLDTILKHLKPEALLLGMSSNDHDKMLNVVSSAGHHGVSVKIEPDVYEIVTGQVRTLQIYGSPLIEVHPELLKPWQFAVKRLIDICMSFAVLVLGFPLWLLIAIIVRLESRGPALFSQQRIGKNGSVFRIYKFRSMVQDAEKHGQQWTKVGDPRVTRFGYFLRKSHLDEIPQMWNIFIGDMSVVGPRPEQPKYVEYFSTHIPYYNRRHKVRPGLTGWWQIKYTSYDESLEEIENRIRFDFFYIENMSLRLDIEIIVRTAILMFRGHGQA